MNSNTIVKYRQQIDKMQMSSIALTMVYQLLTALFTKFTGALEMGTENCIFCDILNGKTDTVLEMESDDFAIFKDIKPAAQHHYLIVPKEHYDSLKVLNESHTKMVTLMEEELKNFFVSKGICTTDALYGFHFPPFISVKHLHMHGIAPRSQISFLSRMMFRPSTAWFMSTQDALTYLRKKSM